MAAMALRNNGAGGHVVLFPLPYHGHLNPMLHLAAALHARGLAVTVLHTEFGAPDSADHPAGLRFVAVPGDVPAWLMASHDVARVLMALNSIFAVPFKDRLRALMVEGGNGVCCVVTDVNWLSAQAAARELGLPALGLMTSSAASFRTMMAYPTLLDKGYLPVQGS
jgi:UDP-glucosyltransferase BX8/BX9